MKQGEKDGNFNPVTEDTQFESGETIILGNGEGVWANVGVRFFVNKKKISIFWWRNQILYSICSFF